MSAVSAARSTFNALKGELSKIYHLGSISALMAYDEQVFMPHNERASQFRGQQNATLAGISHDLSTSKQLGEMIETLHAEQTELNQKEQVVVRLAKRDYDRKTKIPKELVEEEAALSSEGYQCWVLARQTSNFATFVPTLTKWVELRKKMAACLDPSRDAYDVLVDEYERDLSTKRLDEIFSVIREKLVPLAKKIIESAQKKQVDSSILLSKTEQFPISTQEVLNKRIAKELGFNFEEGRMDVSVHPFSISISVADVRITTRYKSSEFVQGMSGTIHETGHALYENGLPREFEGTPLAKAAGMGVHESQSLLWERHVGLSKPFWKKYWPFVQETFPHLKAQEDLDTVFAAINEVQPSLIRVEADEVTYPMHILIRYEIERALFNGTISVEDLPTIWNQKMKEYLGVVPSKDAEGVLQDIHWSSGAFGYFPTYLIGQILAAQIFNTAKKQIPDLEAGFEKGEFTRLKEWLNRNVHSHGAEYNVDQLIQKVTGEPINPNYLVEYLENKYTSIFSA